MVELCSRNEFENILRIRNRYDDDGIAQFFSLQLFSLLYNKLVYI